jgi:hypothetical protein
MSNQLSGETPAQPEQDFRSIAEISRALVLASAEVAWEKATATIGEGLNRLQSYRETRTSPAPHFHTDEWFQGELAKNQKNAAKDELSLSGNGALLLACGGYVAGKAIEAGVKRIIKHGE